MVHRSSAVSKPHLLLACSDEPLILRLRALFAGELSVEAVATEHEARLRMERDDVRGLIVDNRMDPELVTSVLRAFATRLPGRPCALLASLDAPDALMGLTGHGEGVHVIFRPWNDSQVRTVFGAARLEATA